MNCKGKMKGGIDALKPKNFRSSREIDIKLCKIYTKTYIYLYKMLYKIVGLNGLYSANTQPILKQLYPRGA